MPVHDIRDPVQGHDSAFDIIQYLWKPLYARVFFTAGTEFAWRVLYPFLYHLDSHFNVKLKREDIVLDEGLMPAVVTAQDIICAMRNSKGLAMPVKYLEAVRQAAEHGGGGPVLYPFDIIPADFLDRVCIDLTAKRLADQLSAQAM